MCACLHFSLHSYERGTNNNFNMDLLKKFMSVRTDLVSVLQRLGSLDEDAVECADAGADHDSRRSGEAQCARTSDGEHTQPTAKRVLVDNLFSVQALFLHRLKGKAIYC